MNKKLILLGLLAILGTSSCGVFKKDCGCPKFGKVKTAVSAIV